MGVSDMDKLMMALKAAAYALAAQHGASVAVNALRELASDIQGEAWKGPGNR